VDFFAAQDRARRKTWQLALLFGAAVIALVVATNVLIAVVAGFTTTQGVAMGVEDAIAATRAEMWFGISLLVILVIGAASLYKYFVVRAGGRAIAEMLNARQIEPDTTNFGERRLLNVVEEMAIASGMPVPPVYLVEEDAINAFAAGLGTDDAIVGVTRGTITNLDREELQGVIGHEFSHILNGDSRINLRLIALLHGILFLGLLGEMLLRGMRRARRSRGTAPVLALGLGLFVIGYAGTFFGNLIKAAVSRQREFLADAASVQFTRNPGGIADALKKIGGSSVGSTLTATHTKELSHLFFGQAVHFTINRLFATHPPLPDRIRAVEPNWDGQFIPTAAGVSELGGHETIAALSGSPEQIVVEQVGSTDTDHVGAARTRLEAISTSLTAAAHDRADAYALVHALFLSRDSDTRDRQLNLLRASEPNVVVNRVIALAEDALDALQRLTLVTLAAPALKGMSHTQYRRLVTNIVALVRADRRIDLNEWVLHRILLKELAPHFGGRPRPRRTRIARSAEQAAATTVLSAMARCGHGDPQRAFMAGAAVLPVELGYEHDDDENFQRLNAALAALRALPPLAKPSHIKAYAACALTDGVTVEQRALLAGIAAALDCPLPPDFRIPDHIIVS